MILTREQIEPALTRLYSQDSSAGENQRVAADALRSLDAAYAEIAALKAELASMRVVNARIAELERERGVLRDALNRIERQRGYHHDCHLIAAAALAGEQEGLES